MLRQFFIALSQSNMARRFVTRFPPARITSRQFISGETIDECVSVVKDLNARGISVLMNEVGEYVTTREEAQQAAQSFQKIAYRIAEDKLGASISIKPSFLGLGFGKEFFYENMASLVQVAYDLDIPIEMDMEESKDVDTTLAVYYRLLKKFGDRIHIAIAIQVYLHRTQADVQKLIHAGGNIRLVKGAYNESPAIALQNHDAVNQACMMYMRTFLSEEVRKKGCFLALGSHDPVLIEWLLAEADRMCVDKESFEIQMLQGVRQNEQQRLADMGYQVRIYVPYGIAWYPYFMRRLAERPANALLLARSLVSG